MSADQELQDAARAMIAAADAGRPVVPVLRNRCPHVHRQIVRDAKFPGLLALWGRSANFDENVAQVIVHSAILRAIGEVAGVSMHGRFVHAGLLHTYGYLFSLIDTPYGAKRERWLSTALERGFGLESSLLGERPKAGTLLANLTWFLGRIVFRDLPALQRRLASGAAAPAPLIRDYDPGRLRVCRVIERVVVAGRETFIHTDLATYPDTPADSDEPGCLLIYSIQAGRRGLLRLLTAFPIRPSVAEEIRASASGARNVAVRLRYNAYSAGLYGRALRGSRSIACPTEQ